MPPDDEWPGLLADARSQAVVPLLYAWLRASAGREAQARCWIDRIRSECFRVAARHLELSRALRELLHAFAEARLACVPLRGPALAERLYGEHAVRAMGDLDLLVRRDDLSRIRRLLLHRGFRETDRRPGFAERYSYTLEFDAPGPPAVIVEPHWTIAYPPFAGSVDVDRVWSRVLPATVLGVRSASLSSEDLLLHLCLHLEHADEPPLLWSWEINRLIRQEGARFEWAVFVETARVSHTANQTARALGRVIDVFDTPVPAEVRCALGDDGRTRGERLPDRVARAPADGRESLALFFGLQGLREKARYALALLFPAPSFMRSHYGVSGWLALGLAYLRRLCRFAREVAKAMVFASLGTGGPLRRSGADRSGVS